jgi:hypothetical protein
MLVPRLPVPQLPARWVRYFATQSSQTDAETPEMILRYGDFVRSRRPRKEVSRPRTFSALQAA